MESGEGRQGEETVESAKGRGEGRGGSNSGEGERQWRGERGKKQWRVRKAGERAKGSGKKQWRVRKAVERGEGGATVERAKGSGEGGEGSGEWKEGRRGLDSRGLMDFLIRDVGGDSVGQAVDFSGEVVVFAVHL